MGQYLTRESRRFPRSPAEVEQARREAAARRVRMLGIVGAVAAMVGPLAVAYGMTRSPGTTGAIVFGIGGAGLLVGGLLLFAAARLIAWGRRD